MGEVNQTEYDTSESLLKIIEQEGTHTAKGQSASDMLKNIFNESQRRDRKRLREEYRTRDLTDPCSSCFGSRWNEDGELCECQRKEDGETE